MDKDYGKDKVKQICDVIKEETLKPARSEANQMIENARKQAKNILDEAKVKAAEILEETNQQKEADKNVFKASLHLACKKTIASLKQEIEHRLFKEQIFTSLGEHIRDPKIIAKLIDAVAEGLKKEGIDVDMHAYISSKLSAEEVAKFLAADTVKRLKDGDVILSDIQGGARIKLEGKYITLDISEESLKEMVAEFAREDFRELIFHS
jgi:V/A-type H+-transporting ATPase subunit E